MRVYGELGPMVEHRTQFVFKGKREHIAKVSIPNITYPSKDVDTEIPHGSRNHVIVPDAIKITFNLEIESIDKARSEYWWQNTHQKKELIFGSEAIDTINNSDIYDIYN